MATRHRAPLLDAGSGHARSPRASECCARGTLGRGDRAFVDAAHERGGQHR
jgi:hypothetical protein